MNPSLATRRAALKTAGAFAAAATVIPSSAFSKLAGVGLLPPLPVRDLDDEIANVFRGWTAAGSISSHAPFDGVLDDEWADRTFWCADGVFRLANNIGSEPDDVRTLIIRKALEYTRAMDMPDLRETAAGYAFYLRRYSEALYALSFAECTARQSGDQVRHNVELHRAMRQEIERKRQELNPPDYPVLWASADGRHQLLNLTHPFHACETGLRSKVLWLACCKMRWEDPLPTDAMETHPYWTAISREEAVIYSFRERGRYFHAPTLIHTREQTHFVYYPYDDHKALRMAAQDMSHAFGPSFFMAQPAFQQFLSPARPKTIVLPWGPAA